MTLDLPFADGSAVEQLDLLFLLGTADKGRFGSYMKLCDFTLLFMTLQVELRLNKRIISETQTS